jgi:hypothetical protein
MKTLLRSESPVPFQSGYLETIIYPDSFTIKYYDKTSAEYAKNTFANIQYGDTISINGTKWIVEPLEEPVDLEALIVSGKDLGVPIAYLDVFDPHAK